MPTYEYECNACGHRFEELQSFSAAPLKKCPACKKKKLQRLIGAGAAIIFKGTGFHQTDYRSDSYKTAAQADQPKPTTEKTGTDAPPNTTAAKPATGSETKSETKAPGKKPKS